jgi:hypothetical protein
MADKIVIKRRTEPNQGPRPPGSKRPSTAVLVLGALCAVVGLSGWLYVRARYAADRAAQAQRAASEEVKQAEAAVARAKAEAAERLAARQAEPTGREQVVDDPDGQLLWASPTEGSPIPISFTPAGAQCLLHFRPALFASHPESEKVLASLGPWGEAALAALRDLMLADLNLIEHATIAILVDDDGRIEVSAVAGSALGGPWDDARIAERLPTAQKKEYASQTYFVADDRACYLTDAAAKGSFLVACPAHLVEELIDAEDQPPMLPRDLESLHATSDADRMATIIASPHFFDAAGSDVLTGDAAPLREALAALVDDRASAVAISAHWNENFFIELRAAPALNVPPRSLAATLQQRVDELPDTIDDVILAQAWPSYGRKVLARFPGMLRHLAANTRRGDADKQALLRAYLPAVAGHNLLMGAELLLTQRNASSPAGEAEAPKELTLNERLERPTTVSFAKETLQRALELLAEEIDAEIKIEGNELRAEGITQNQTLAIDLHDRPAREILTEILRRANPDRTAENAADSRQKLVYVVEDGDAAPGRMIVTTRAAALRRGLALPADFASSPE